MILWSSIKKDPIPVTNKSLDSINEKMLMTKLLEKFKETFINLANKIVYLLGIRTPGRKEALQWILLLYIKYLCCGRMFSERIRVILLGSSDIMCCHQFRFIILFTLLGWKACLRRHGSIFGYKQRNRNSCNDYWLLKSVHFPKIYCLLIIFISCLKLIHMLDYPENILLLLALMFCNSGFRHTANSKKR